MEIMKETGCDGVDWIQLARDRASGYCEHSNAPVGYIKHGKFVDTTERLSASQEECLFPVPHGRVMYITHCICNRASVTAVLQLYCHLGRKPCRIFLRGFEKQKVPIFTIHVRAVSVTVLISAVHPVGLMSMPGTATELLILSITLACVHNLVSAFMSRCLHSACNKGAR
jgi:hypothetical protein